MYTFPLEIGGEGGHPIVSCSPVLRSSLLLPVIRN